MQYDFLPNISKTTILDGIVLSLAQQLYLKKIFKPEPIDDVEIIWNGRQIGRSFAIALTYIETMLNPTQPTITVSDHFNGYAANKALLEKVVDLVKKDPSLCLILERTLAPGKPIRIKIKKVGNNYGRTEQR